MIEPTELAGLRLSADGKFLCLRMRDQNGQMVSLSLPTCWLNAMLSALPRHSDSEMVHPLDSWSMDRVGNGHEVILTLRTPDGQAVSFAMKPWQVEGMATIATYGASGRPSTTIH